MSMIWRQSDKGRFPVISFSFTFLSFLIIALYKPRSKRQDYIMIKTVTIIVLVSSVDLALHGPQGTPVFLTSFPVVASYNADTRLWCKKYNYIPDKFYSHLNISRKIN